MPEPSAVPPSKDTPSLDKIIIHTTESAEGGSKQVISLPLPPSSKASGPVATSSGIITATSGMPPMASSGAGLTSVAAIKAAKAAVTSMKAAMTEWHTPLDPAERRRLKTGPSATRPIGAPLKELPPISPRIKTNKGTVATSTTVGNNITNPVPRDPAVPLFLRTLPAVPYSLPCADDLIKGVGLSYELVLGIPWDNHLAQPGLPEKYTHGIKHTDFFRMAFEAYNGAWFNANNNEPILELDEDLLKSYDTRPMAHLEILDFGEEEEDEDEKQEDETEVVQEEEPEPEKEPEEPVKPQTPGPLTRPNGETYFPRRVRTGRGQESGLYDVDLIRQAYDERLPVLLFGPPGTGKTSMAEAALSKLITISGTADTDTSDFVGGFVQLEDRSFKWVDGPLVTAMLEGRPLLVDEIAQIDPRVLAVLYSVMDGRGELTVPANPQMGTIKAADGFYVIGACNPDSYGSVMSDALLSRFTLQIEVTTDYEALKELGIDDEILAVAANLARKAKVAGGGVTRAPQARELIGYQKIKKVFGRDLALSGLISSADPQDRDVYKKTIEPFFSVQIDSLKV